MAAHGAGLWGLLQVSAVQAVLREAAPTWVEFIATPRPPLPEPPAPRPPAPALRPTPRPPVPVPQVIAAAPAPVAPTATVTVPEPDVAPVPPAPVDLARSAVASGPPPAPPSPPPVVPATAVQYRVLPAVEVPLASRRAGEQGTVWLRVRVGRDGLPQQITLHRSSGHDRLDQQALAAMREARFQPQTLNGEPIEWTVVAPLLYELD